MLTQRNPNIILSGKICYLKKSITDFDKNSIAFDGVLVFPILRRGNSGFIEKSSVER